MTEGITNPSEKYFKDGHWTFDGSVWRPQNQLIAYRDTVHAQYINNDAAAGTVNWDNTAVPTGEVYVYTSVIAYNATTAAAYLIFYALSGAVSSLFDYSAYKTPTRFQTWAGQLVLKAGDILRVTFAGTVLHDILAAYVNGYSFKIAE